jgi:hypothetical protein
MFHPHRILDRTHELINYGRSFGVKLTLYKIVRWGCSSSLLKRWVRFSIADVFTLSITGLKGPPRIPKFFTVRHAEDKDISALDLFYSKPGKTRARLQRGDDCIIAFRAGQICGASWTTLGPTDYCDDLSELGSVFHIPQNACWTYDGLGVKLGAWACVQVTLFQQLQSLGIEEIFCQIDCANTQCLNSHKSLGYHSLGNICHLRIPGISIQYYRNRDGRWRRLPGRMGTLELCTRDSQLKRQNEHSASSTDQEFLSDP